MSRSNDKSPRSDDRGLIEALIPHPLLSKHGLSPRSDDRGLIEAVREHYGGNDGWSCLRGQMTAASLKQMMALACDPSKGRVSAVR